MDRGYNRTMLNLDREALAMRGDMGMEACAVRLMAARMVAQVSQQQIADEVGVRKTAYSNMETARSFPSRGVMQYFYRRHRIDFNFLMHGDFAQLPGDVQETLFLALATARSEWDRKERSDRARRPLPSLRSEKA